LEYPDVYCENENNQIVLFQPCQFGPLNALKELNINAAFIEDEEVIRSMELPNLKFLDLSHTSTTEWVS
jgi:hypothetical protein